MLRGMGKGDGGTLKQPKEVPPRRIQVIESSMPFSARRIGEGPAEGKCMIARLDAAVLSWETTSPKSARRSLLLLLIIG